MSFIYVIKVTLSVCQNGRVVKGTRSRFLITFRFETVSLFTGPLRGRGFESHF